MQECLHIANEVFKSIDFTKNNSECCLKVKMSFFEIWGKIQNIEGQNININESFNIATCFFALNDFNYSDVEDMLKNISKNINGIFIVLFFDYSLFKDDIDSPCVKYRQCIDTRTNKFINRIDKNSPVYLIGSLRYAHKECDNIMFVDINNSNVTNHYENAIKSNKIIQIFEKFHFNLIEEFSVDPFPFLNHSQQLYTSFLKVIKFSNINNN